MSIAERYRAWRPSPNLTLAIGVLVFIGLIAAGFIFEWGFGGGLAVMVGAFLASVVWAFDWAGSAVIGDE